MTDYDLEVYVSRGASELGHALSRKSSHTLTVLDGAEELNRDFANLNLEVIGEGELEQCLGALAIQPSFFKKFLSS